MTSTEALTPQDSTVGQNSLILQLLKSSLTMMKLGMVPLESSFFRLLMMRSKDMLRRHDCLPLDDPNRFKASYRYGLLSNEGWDPWRRGEAGRGVVKAVDVDVVGFR